MLSILENASKQFKSTLESIWYLGGSRWLYLVMGYCVCEILNGVFTLKVCFFYNFLNKLKIKIETISDERKNYFCFRPKIQFVCFLILASFYLRFGPLQLLSKLSLYNYSCR